LKLVAFQLPTHYHPSNWPKKLRLRGIIVLDLAGCAKVAKQDGSDLSPNVPLDQLARFLNHHVDEANELMMVGNDEMGIRHEECLPQLVETVRPERFTFESVMLTNYFHLLPWPTVERVYNSENMSRVKSHKFNLLQLPPGVDPRAFLMELRAIRECEKLIVYSTSTTYPPQFTNAMLFEWIKLRERKDVSLPVWFLADPIQHFVDMLGKVG